MTRSISSKGQNEWINGNINVTKQMYNEKKERKKKQKNIMRN